MSLLDALKDPPKQPTHRITEILDKVGNAESEALQDALADASVWPSESLARTLTASGHKISASSVLRYRREVLGISK